jgi:hypothetical protein
MIGEIALIAFNFIVLTDLEGKEVALSVSQIVSITRGKDGEANKLLTDKAKCIIGLTDGKFLTTATECDDVLRMIVNSEDKGK